MAKTSTTLLVGAFSPPKTKLETPLPKLRQVSPPKLCPRRFEFSLPQPDTPSPPSSLVSRRKESRNFEVRV